MTTATAPKNGKAPVVTAPTPVEQQVEFDAKSVAVDLFRGMGTLLKIKLRRAKDLEQQAVYYGIRDLFSNDLTFEYSRQHDKKAFPWSTFSQGFEEIFGKPDEMQYTARQMVAIAAYLIPGVPQDADEAIKFFLDQNRHSLRTSRIINVLKPKDGTRANADDVKNAFKKNGNKATDFNFDGDDDDTPSSTTSDDEKWD